MMTIIRSTACPPICNPKLPPLMLKGAGAVQPSAVRQVATPLPYAPPIPRPPLSNEGTTATHLAELRISSGIPLSGVAMISFSTLAADSTRLAAVSANTGDRHRTVNHRKMTAFFMFLLPQKIKVSSLRLLDAEISLWRERRKNNKGLDSATLVTVSNPCLPGSVVGE